MQIDVLIPTFARPAALAATLTSLAAQTFRDFGIIISDQTEDFDAVDSAEVQNVLRVLNLHGHAVTVHKHLPRRGMAEQRGFLLERATAPNVLFLDDDLILEPYVIGLMKRVLEEERCGFVGCAPIGLSYADDVRPHEQDIEVWEGRVAPESVTPESCEWSRYRLHNAANVLHVQEALRATPSDPVRYHIAWVGGCALYRSDALRECGGFAFWRELPSEHCGEDVLAQLRVMERYGGCGILPSGVYHQELPTTLPHREVDAAVVLGNRRA
jgi:GT2 family glycosyltransferase